MAQPGDGAVLTLAAARAHLRVTPGYSADDLAPLIAAAEGRIASFLGRPLIDPDRWASADDVPALVVHSTKLALSDFFVNRESPELTDDQLRPIIGQYMAISVG